ncbi:MAG: MarR family transcriptional regulator [Dyadobacter sp.]|uniref:MarR family winged helix-turn-helix transcriptional regulator n=1 Tax=Dyadobacter sp. TaxID=1914288 RepID=UPI001AFF33B0|nr:winged helix DNA-binding protein [Dyadobacter sp.]MBO9611195.1 MarR family transcriptional regulator [Dyadobacter sp.]
MKPIVELISAWDSFQETRPDATVADFCRHYLAMMDAAGSDKGLFSGIEPPDMTSTIAKLVGRLGAMLTTYSKLALKEGEEIELDWFYCLNAIFHQGEARKIDIITYNFLEQTTGIDMLNRLRKAGYISERADPSDKRAKLVQLTVEGKQLLFKLYERLYLPAHMLFGEMSKADSHLMVNLLGPIEQKHGKILEVNRARNFADLLAETLGPEKLDEINRYQQNQIARFAAGKE